MFTTRSPTRPGPATDWRRIPAAFRPAVADGAVLLIGHGSTRSPRPDAMLARLAARLQAEGRIAEVAAATLTGRPSPRERLAAMNGRHVLVVPMLMCDGVLFREAVPQALGLASGRRGEDDRQVRLCPPIGLHPMIAELIHRRAAAAADDAGLRPAEATLLLIGHGSGRDRASAAAAERQAERLRQRALWARVETAFIGQAPHLTDALDRLPRPLLGVALFTAHGNHVSVDIESRFRASQSTELRFLGAIGEDQGILELINLVIEEHIY